VLAPLNFAAFAIGSSFEALNATNLGAIFPEVAASLALNPAGFEEMLDANTRAEEVFYADRAREGEFGYSVRRRLHNMGYNV
jgi:hypothetical protein